VHERRHVPPAMTPGARAAAAIAILERQVESKAPADLVAGSHFRSNRYIGSKDRQAIAAIVYGVLRTRAQLDWWIGREGRLDPNTRLRVLAWMALAEGWTANQLAGAFDGDRFRPAPLDAAEGRFAERLETRTLDHPGQPPAVRLNLPDWIMPALQESLGASASADLEALNQPAQLDPAGQRAQDPTARPRSPPWRRRASSRRRHPGRPGGSGSRAGRRSPPIRPSATAWSRSRTRARSSRRC